MNRKALLFLCLISVVLSLLALKTDARAVGTDIFVSADGGGTDCTQSAPCKPDAALVMANTGDRLYFRAGTYTGTADNILTIDKGISLYGGWDGAPADAINLDPENFTTIFDGQSARRLILVDYTSVEPEPIRIIWFHFINGRADNPASGFGGAIYIKNGGVLIEDNQFNYNQAIYYGGAIYIETTLPVGIEDNSFSENQAVNGGGAIYVSFPTGATPEISIEGNHFSGGSAPYGTAIHVSGAAVHITRNFVKGGSGSSAILLVTSNVAPSIITNNVIVGSDKALDFSNAATDQHQVWNNTIVDCEVGIEIGESVSIHAVNNIITGCDSSFNFNYGSVSGSHNLFYNNNSADHTLPLTDSLIDTPPSFVDAAGDDYHLSTHSEAIDAGATVDLLFDFDGDERPSGSGFDIGADEVMTTRNLFLPLILR